MTTKNAILLIVKQNPGIDYNSLLNKFVSSYSNANSARAALSRSLKDLTIFGFLAKKENRYHLLDKGEGEMYSEIKNKLVLALNSLMNSKHPADEIDSIVEKLQILVERGRQDRDLLKTSRTSLDFSISELEGVSAELDKKVKHLEYISKVFSEQINSVKELGFNDSYSRPFEQASLQRLEAVFSGQPDNELTVECFDIVLLDSMASKFSGKAKNNSISIQKSLLPSLLDFLGQSKGAFSAQPINLFSSALKAQFQRDKILLSGPYPELEKWKK